MTINVSSLLSQPLQVYYKKVNIQSIYLIKFENVISGSGFILNIPLYISLGHRIIKHNRYMIMVHNNGA